MKARYIWLLGALCMLAGYVAQQATFDIRDKHCFDIWQREKVMYKAWERLYCKYKAATGSIGIDPDSGRMYSCEAINENGY